ncbi:MAG: SHOCT domain-containing protein [Janthinobacterium lividum]
MNSPLDTLKQLKEMLDAGTITPQEFEALKQQMVFGQATTSASPAAEMPAAAVVNPLVPEPAAPAPLPDPVGPPPAATPVAPPPTAPTETPEWLAAAAPLLMPEHPPVALTNELRRNPLTLVFAIGGALVLLALVLYLTLDNKHESERLTSASKTAADSTAVVPEVGPQSEQITLPPATAPETVRVAPRTAPVVPAAAMKFHSDSVAAPAPVKVPAGTMTTVATDSAMVQP